MMRRRPLPPGNQRHQVLLRMIRVARLRPAQAVRHTKHVRVHRQRRLSKRIGHDHVRRLAAHARKRDERLQVGGDLTPEAIAETLRHPEQAPRLRVEEAGGADQCLERFGVGHRERRRIRIGGEDRRGDLVDPLVRALRREDRRHEQLEGVLVTERAELGCGSRVRLGQPRRRPVGPLAGSPWRALGSRRHCPHLRPGGP